LKIYKKNVLKLLNLSFICPLKFFFTLRKAIISALKQEGWDGTPGWKSEILNLAMCSLYVEERISQQKLQ